MPVDTSAPVKPDEGDGPSVFEETLEAHLQHAETASNEPPPTAAWGATTAVPDGVAQVEAASKETDFDQTVTSQTNAQPDPAVGVQETSSDEQPTPPATPSGPPPQPDPLTELPTAVWYVRPPSGGQFGPAQADMMRGWLNEGRVSPDTLVWREGWADWKEASSVFPQLQPAATAVPEAPPVPTADGDAITSYRPGSRRRNGPNMGLIAVLIAAVLILLLVLIWVLSGGAREPSSGHDSAVAVSVMECSASETSPTAS